MPRPRALVPVVLLAAVALVALGRHGARADAVRAAVPADRPRGPGLGVAAEAPVRLPPLRRLTCPLEPSSAALLPASARRGLVRHLRQYPVPALATARQRRAAERLLARLRRSTAAWRDATAAERAGFATGRAARRPGDRGVHWLHAEHRLFSADRRFLDPERPEALIYANAPGRPLVLVGLMFSMRRGLAGPTPGGPLTRWHSHLVCMRGEKRGLKPRADGSCPTGATRRQGSEMMHVWFTRDVRSAFAVQAPGPELCRAGLLPAAECRDPAAIRVM